VEQALPYYDKFITKYPTIFALAEAEDEQILEAWTGLGYYARARNMLKAAKILVRKYHGNFPENYNDAIKLPGIGPYTAAAILSIAFKGKFPVVDGNVIRVITRIFAINDDVRQESTKKSIYDLCAQLIDTEDPGNFNEGLMELGAVICKPKSPNCSFCPLKAICLASQKKLLDSIPYKSPPRAKSKKTQYVFAIRRNESVLLVKRPENGLLASMWELPSVNVDDLQKDPKQLSVYLDKHYGLRGRILAVSEPMNHTYSHIKMQYKAVLVDHISGKVKMGSHTNKRWQRYKKIDSPSLHRAHQKIIEWIVPLEIKSKGKVSS
jgi:A/G-specific adenine glycosylase